MSGSRFAKRPFFYIVLLIAMAVLAISVFPRGSGSEAVPLVGGSESVLERLRNQQPLIDLVELDNTNIALSYNDGREFKAQIPRNVDFLEFLDREGVDVSAAGFPDLNAKESGGFGSILGVFVNFLPLIIFGGILIFMLRQAQGSNSQAMSFGKSKPKVVTANRPTTTFNDVAGAVEPKEELQEVVEFLKFPERFAALGARIPRGVLLVGLPGTGKTLLSRAVAGEAGVPFYSISGSEFVEMFVGVGASRVRDLFDQAKKNAPAIIFIDEIDAVGRQRGAGLGGSHDEREQTLNQILVEMDGFENNTGIIVIAATNRPDILDPALMRPGRFDRQVVLDAPDVKGREAILAVHAEGKPLAEDVGLDVVAKETPGFSGADLANLLNEAAILAARRNKKLLTNAELEEAVDRVMAGPARKSRILTGKEKEIVAYHESGHALVAAHIPGHDPVHKVTIVPRGMAGGFTRYLPEDEHRLAAKSYYQGFMASALGGHMAEELVFGEATTGAHDDLNKATAIARNMVTKWGMSEKLGPRTFGKQESMVFLGREVSEQRDYSERTAEQIDDEVRELVDRARDMAHRILGEHRETLDLLADRLTDKETLEGTELTEILNRSVGDPIQKDSTQPRTQDSPPTTNGASKNEKESPETVMPPKPGLVWGGNANYDVGK